jgi:glycosyltransferase involved in cell wall biosynthesis
MSPLLYATRLFDDPIVIYCKRWSMFNVESGLQEEPMHPIVGLLAHRDVVWLIPSPWLAEDKWAGPIYRRTLASIKSIAPSHRIIFVANTSAEGAHFKRLGLEYLVANQNQFADRALFRPLPNAPHRRFDAVYNARFMKYKRHELARCIDHLALVGYSFEAPDFPEIRSMLKFAHLANQKEGTLQLLSETEVNEILNQAGCGLCLSSVEGAMTASVEYLLAGIPVVTTTNRGGRDFFFDGRFTRWVEPEANAVAREVKNLVEERISPEFIRVETIRKIDSANEEFFTTLASMLAIPRTPLAAQFALRFNHRLASPKPYADFLQDQ